MPVVTALRQARGGRIAVEIDGSHRFTVGQALVARWRLHVDRDLAPAELAALVDDAHGEAALADAHRLLSHRGRSRHELSQRLLRKGHPRPVVEGTLARLEQTGLIDDAAFARALVADKRRLAGWGRDRIAHELERAGIDRSVADDALGPADPDAETERAVAALRRRPDADRTSERGRKRAHDFLRRRGFCTAVIYEAIRRWPDD